MGVYQRGNKLWLSYIDATGKRVRAPSPFAAGDERKAEKFLADVERQIKAEKSHAPAGGVVTVASYSAKWLEGRPAQVSSYRDDISRVNAHIVPLLGQVPLADLRPRHVRDFARALKVRKSDRGTPLAQRTQRLST